MAEVRMVKRVAIKDMEFPAPVIVRDIAGRVESLTYTYESIIVTYNASWTDNLLNTYTQTIVDA